MGVPIVPTCVNKNVDTRLIYWLFCFLFFDTIDWVCWYYWFPIIDQTSINYWPTIDIDKISMNYQPTIEYQFNCSMVLHCIGLLQYINLRKIT